MDDSKLVELTKENMKLKAKVKKLEKELEVNSIDRSTLEHLTHQTEDHIRSISFLEDMVERQEAQIKDLREVARLLSRAYSSDPSDLV